MEIACTDRPFRPIMGLVAGLQAVNRRVMGHAGALRGSYSGSAEAKIQSLEQVGVVMTDHPAKFGAAMRSLLAAELEPRSVKGVEKPPTSPPAAKRFIMQQHRSIHTSTRPLKSRIIRSHLVTAKRCLYVKGPQALNLLYSWGIPTLHSSARSRYFRLKLNLSRLFFMPYIAIEHNLSGVHSVNVDYGHTAFRMDEPAEEIDRRIQLLCRQDWGSFGPKSPFPEIICNLRRMFMEKEGRVFSVLLRESTPNKLGVFDAHLKFTNEAFRSAGRHADIHALEDWDTDVPEEIEAGKHGIVYIKLVPL